MTKIAGTGVAYIFGFIFTSASTPTIAGSWVNSMFYALGAISFKGTSTASVAAATSGGNTATATSTAGSIVISGGAASGYSVALFASENFNTATVSAPTQTELFIDNAATDGTCAEYATGASSVTFGATYATGAAPWYAAGGNIVASTLTCLPGSSALMGVGCSIGWRASLLGGAAWRAGKAIERNNIVTRRRLILPSRRSLIGHNGGPRFED